VKINTASEARAGEHLDRPEWAGYFDRLTARLEDGLDLDATVEIIAEDLTGTEADGVPLISITWEAGDEQIAIGLGERGRRRPPAAVWHYVERPSMVWVHEYDAVPTAIAIEDDNGVLNLLRATRPDEA
jgi:hypothetical protein